METMVHSDTPLYSSQQVGQVLKALQVANEMAPQEAGNDTFVGEATEALEELLEKEAG